MAWEIFSPSDVEAVTGIDADSLDDAMYDEAIGFAEEWTGRKLSGQQSYVNELHDGDGSDTLFVRHPPITAVSSLTINGHVYPANLYEVYDSYIRSLLFPVGIRNISVSYTGGYDVSAVPYRIQRGLKLLVVQFGIFYQRAGADASSVFDNAQPRDTGSEGSGGGQLSTTERIALTWFGRRVRAH